jgi:hypothetical protein
MKSAGYVLDRSAISAYGLGYQEISDFLLELDEFDGQTLNTVLLPHLALLEARAQMTRDQLGRAQIGLRSLPNVIRPRLQMTTTEQVVHHWRKSGGETIVPLDIAETAFYADTRDWPVVTVTPCHP